MGYVLRGAERTLGYKYSVILISKVRVCMVPCLYLEPVILNIANEVSRGYYVLLLTVLHAKIPQRP